MACGWAVATGCLALSGGAFADTVKLVWNRNPEANVVAYEVSYGTAPGIYPNTFDVGNKIGTTITGLEKGSTYYFVVVARNKAGQLGPKSDELVYQVSGRASVPPSGTIVTPTDTVTIEAGEKVYFTGSGTDPNNSPLTYSWDFGAESGLPDSKVQNPGNLSFSEPGTYNVTLTVKNELGTPDPSPEVRTIIVKKPSAELLSRKRWKLKFVDSQEVTGYAATNAFDGNPGTFWHTEFKDAALVKEPHEIQIDMGKASEISGFKYLSRQDGMTIGDIGKYKFYISMDGKKWGKPVSSGTFGKSSAEKVVFFKAKKGRYLRLQSVSEINGYTDTNVAELHVYKFKKKSKAAAAGPVSHTAAVASATGSAGTKSTASAIAAAAAIPASQAPPSSPSAVTTTEIIDGRKYLAITIAKPLVADGVKRTVQVSPDLLDWFSGEKHTTVVIDNATTLKVRDNTPITADRKRFIRMKETSR